jgi:CRISPR-associated protein Csb2
MTHLLLTVRFLDDRYHGLLASGGPPEWPPSPFRLFCALVAGVARRGELEGDAGRALAWLQTLDPPDIIAPEAMTGQAITRYVPNNDGDKKPDRQDRLGTKSTIPTLFLLPPNQNPEVHYLWNIRQIFKVPYEHIRTAARSLTALGWGIDMAFADAKLVHEEEIRRLSGTRWCPTRGEENEGGIILRVPTTDAELQESTLEDLKYCHQTTMQRISHGEPLHTVDAPRVYERVLYIMDPPPRHRAAFRLLHPTEDRSAVFAQTRANHVAAMTRNAMARIAAEQGQPQEWINRYVHGHRRQGEEESLPRFSYLPLPTIEPRGREGEVLGAIRRLLVAELVDSEESDLRWARQMLPGQFLTDDKTGERKAMLAPLSREDWVLQRYVGRSDIWATVTPVVLPGSDDGKWAKAEKLFFKALRHAGYSPDALAELEFRNVSFWPGGDWALQFQRPDYLKEACWSVYHVRLRWKQEVAGPIALGAGRHCGLGTFAIFQVGSR